MQEGPVHPLISIIIVNFNGLRFLEPCLSSLADQTYAPFEVIVADNGSSDSSVDCIREHFPNVVVLELETNTGFAGGTNAGIRRAGGDFILTLNNDTVVDPRFLEEIIRPMLEDPQVGMCGSKMVLPDGRINSTAICFSRSGAAWDRGTGEDDTGQFDLPEEIFGPCAGAALYRRSMLDEIGLFDEDFFLFMEDVDLAFRARLAGWTCRYVPTASVVHVQGGSYRADADMPVYYGNRNLFWYIVKDFPAPMLLTSLPWIVGRNCADIPFYLMKGRGRAIFRAKADMCKGLFRMIRKRKTVRQKIPAKEIRRWISPPRFPGRHKSP